MYSEPMECETSNNIVAILKSLRETAIIHYYIHPIQMLLLHCRDSSECNEWISCSAVYLSDYQHTGDDLLCIPTEREVDTVPLC